MDALYLSTITRSTGVLLGAAFAMVWRPRAIMRSHTARPLASARPRRHRRAGDPRDSSSGTCRSPTIRARPTPGCSAAASSSPRLATLMMIAAVTHRYALTGRILAIRPLLWVGTRSYGLYLFHWPIYQIIRKVAGCPVDLAAVRGRDGGHRRRSPSCRTGSSRCRSAAASSGRGGTACGGAALPAPRQAMAMTVVVCLLLLAVGVIRLGLAELKPNEVEATLAEGAREHDVARGPARAPRARPSGTAGTTAPQDVPTGSTQPATTDSVPGTVEPRRPRRRRAPRRRPRPCPPSRSTTSPSATRSCSARRAC